MRILATIEPGEVTVVMLLEGMAFARCSAISWMSFGKSVMIAPLEEEQGSFPAP
jgi:hypothetical protein